MRIDKNIKKTISLALAEDSADSDITSSLLIPENIQIKAKLIAKEPGVLCGIDIAKAVFKHLDRKVIFRSLKKDGITFRSFEEIASIQGSGPAVLGAERVALNFLSFLSATATLTRKFLQQVRGTKVKIMDTRKTIPNLRRLQKYAVLTGGGMNHRLSLAEAILIKDNHLQSGCFLNKRRLDTEKLLKLFRRSEKKSLAEIVVEVENLNEFRQMIKIKPGVIMLDNFSLADMKTAALYREEHYPAVKLEASGGINLANAKKVAKSGVDFISIGALTHSAPAIDFSLEIR